MNGGVPAAGRRPLGDRPALFATVMTLAVGAVCAAVAWPAVGPGGAGGAAVATLVVLAFFGSGAVPLRLADQAHLPLRAGMGLVVLTYALRLVVVVGGLAVAATVPGLHHRTLGVTLIIVALVWPLARLAAMVASSQLRN